MKNISQSELLAAVVGLIVGAGAVYLLQTTTPPNPNQHLVNASDAYHVHADFVVITNEKVRDFSSSTFTTDATQELHPHAHLHDQDGDVLHLHQPNITFAEFFESLGGQLTHDCLTLPTGETFCDDQSTSFILYVNEEPWSDPITTYVPDDLDRILLFYGDPTTALIEQYLDAVPNDACVFSGSCPERGVAPPESCGLTCEL